MRGGTRIRGRASRTVLRPGHVPLSAPLAKRTGARPEGRFRFCPEQDSRFTSMHRAASLRVHDPGHSMSRRGNRHSDAVAESCIDLPKRARIRQRICRSRLGIRRHAFDYIEIFHDPTGKRHGHSGPNAAVRLHPYRLTVAWSKGRRRLAVAVVSRLSVVLLGKSSFPIRSDDGLVVRKKTVVCLNVVSGLFKLVETDAYPCRIKDGRQKGTAPGDGALIAAL